MKKSKSSNSKQLKKKIMISRLPPPPTKSPTNPNLGIPEYNGKEITNFDIE